MAQAVSPRPLTSEARVRTLIGSCGVVVDNVTLKKVIFSSSVFLCHHLIVALHAHIHGGLTRGPLLAVVQGPILTPSTKTTKYWAILWNSTAYYRLHTSPPPTVNLDDSAPYTSVRFLWVPFQSTVFLSKPKSCERYIPFRLSNQYVACIFHRLHTCYTNCSYHPRQPLIMLQ
jgi:hypothetical protein